MNMIFRLIGRFISFFRRSRRTARAVIFHGEEVFLVKHRLSGKYWSIPGGGLEKNEGPHQAIRRELHEELGIKDFEIKECGDLQYLSHNQIITSTIFKVEIGNKDMKIDWIEIKDSGWFALEELPEMVLPAQEAVLLCKKHV